jgi:hypothetical protein
MGRRPWVARWPAAPILGDCLDELIGAGNGGRHPDRQSQVAGFQRPEALLPFRLPARSLLSLQSLLGRPSPGGDQQLGYAHAIVERLTRSQPQQVDPPDRALVTASEHRPHHALEGELTPHFPQLLLGGLEQLQTQSGR